MFLIVMWYAEDRGAARRLQRGRRRVESSTGALVPDTYVRRDLGGDDWGISVWHPRDEGAFRWPTIADGDRITAISLGIPVGADTTGGPIGMARRLIDGEDVHASVVPPFGLIAMDGTDRVVIQEDWLGQCRLFTSTSRGVTAFSNRPTLLAQLTAGDVKPSRDGWESYAVAGQFGGSTSPIEGVRLLEPGERVTCRRRMDRAGWIIANEIRFALDDAVRAGLAARDAGLDATLDGAAAALQRTVMSVTDLYNDEILLGLSGGKDSRLLAGAFIAAGRLPNLVTNNDTVAEGETAERLVEIIGATRGLHPRHTISRAGEAATVLDVGLVERVTRLQRQYDFQFPSTYVVRRAMPERLRPNADALSITGAGGELAIGYWYGANPDESPGALQTALFDTLLRTAGDDAAPPQAMDNQRERVSGILHHAASIGLVGAEQLDYVYLMERMRRWSASAYSVGMVTPYLAPDVVAATFALTADQKRARALHSGLLRRFMPEWVEVPYVAVSTGRSRAARVWDGDGLAALRDLLNWTSATGIAGLVRPDAVRCALRDCRRGVKTTSHRRTLEQYAALVVASRTLEPAGPLSTWTIAARRARREGLIPGQRFARRVVRTVVPRSTKVG